MARRDTRQVNRQNNYVSGNLAFDYDYLEREQRRIEREEREYAERQLREARRKSASGKRPAEQIRHRERIQVSNLVVIGFGVLAALVVAILMSYAQLAIVSHGIVGEQKQLAALEEEHIKLLARYESTFDLTSVKEAAETAGMAKPSASQIFYVDLSAPDNVVLYEKKGVNPFGQVFTSMGHNMGALVEYFK